MNIDRLFRIHEMILHESTGTPAEFAELFHIQIRQLQNLMNELVICGAAIGYSRKRATYFYKEPFDFLEQMDYLHISRYGTDKLLKELLKNW